MWSWIEVIVTLVIVIALMGAVGWKASFYGNYSIEERKKALKDNTTLQ